MRVRRFVVGVLLLGLFSGGLARQAAAEPLAPGLPDIPLPGVGVPSIDPNNPQLPSLPFIPIPAEVMPFTGLISPVTPVLCTLSYLAPLAGAVAMTAIFQQLPVQPPVPPSFLSPLFGPVITACVIALFPDFKSCGPDADITAALATVGGSVPDPGVGAVPAVDPFATVPAPFASIVNEVQSIQNLLAALGAGARRRCCGHTRRAAGLHPLLDPGERRLRGKDSGR